jgi:hypothetical protein
VRTRALFLAAALLAACDRHAGDRLTDLTPEGAVPGASADWVLYADELRTGGGFYLIPEAANQAIVDGDPAAAAVGRSGITYTWNGGAVNAQHLFAGFGLLVAQTIFQDASTPARDLSGQGFTRIAFRAKGSLGENVILRVEGPGDGSNATVLPRLEITRSELAAGWARYELPVPSPAAFASVKQYVNFILVYDQPTGTTLPGEGGTVHIDQVAYER